MYKRAQLITMKDVEIKVENRKFKNIFSPKSIDIVIINFSALNIGKEFVDN